MTALFIWCMQRSIAASWLILAVLLVRLLLQRAPKWIGVLLWGIVALRLVLPFSIKSVLSLRPSAGSLPQTVIAAVSAGQRSAAAARAFSIAFDHFGVAANRINPVQICIGILTIVWIAGIFCMLLYTAISSLRLRRSVRMAVLLRDNLYQCEAIGVPFVFGLVKPRIYLPFDMGGQDMYYVVCHETAHIQRKDHWLKPIGFALLTVYWFNPLIWLAYVLFCRDMELACDERVIRGLDNHGRADYMQTLLRLSVKNAGRTGAAACPVSFAESGIKARVRSAARYKKPALWIVLAAILLCAAVGVCFLTDPIRKIPNPAVQAYTAGAPGMAGNVDTAYYEQISPDFAIGADAYGMAVFKDPVQAFATMTALYGDGITLIQNAYDLPPITPEDYTAYKTYGAQITTGTQAAREEAAFVARFLDIYENSFRSPSLPNGAMQATASQVQVWFDYYNDGGMQWDGRQEISLDAFPGVVFCWTPEKVEAVYDDGTIDVLYTGMPIWSVFFADLTGDGLPELCSTLSMGSGIADERVMIYDYANGASYTLEDRMGYNFSLSFEDEKLIVSKRVFQVDRRGEVVERGYLAYTDCTLQVIPLP